MNRLLLLFLPSISVLPLSVSKLFLCSHHAVATATATATVATVATVATAVTAATTATAAPTAADDDD